MASTAKTRAPAVTETPDSLVERLSDPALDSHTKKELCHKLAIAAVNAPVEFRAEAETALMQIREDAEDQIVDAVDAALFELNARTFARYRSESEASARRKLEDLGFERPDELVGLVEDSTAPTKSRVAACIVLQRFPVANSWRALVAAIGEGEMHLAWAAADALINARSLKPTRELIRILLNHPSQHSRQAAIHALHWLRDTRARSALIAVLDSNTLEAYTRGLAAEALGHFPDHRRIIDALVRASEDTSAELLQFVVCALSGKAADSKVRRVLTKLSRDGSIVDDGRTLGEWATEALEAEFTEE